VGNGQALGGSTDKCGTTGAEDVNDLFPFLVIVQLLIVILWGIGGYRLEWAINKAADRIIDEIKKDRDKKT
jgi:hypothetical protein